MSLGHRLVYNPQRRTLDVHTSEVRLSHRMATSLKIIVFAVVVPKEIVDSKGYICEADW